MSSCIPEDPELAVLRAEFPAWEFWPGIDSLLHARKPYHYDPEGRPLMAWGRDADGLRAAVKVLDKDVFEGDDDG